MAEPTIAINHMSQCCEKLFPIDVISVDALTGISTTGDVIKGTGELNAKGTRHASTLPERMRYCKTWPHPTPSVRHGAFRIIGQSSDICHSIDKPAKIVDPEDRIMVRKRRKVY